MAPRPDIALPVDAVGSLRVDTPGGQRIDVVADGSRVRVEAPHWKELRQLGPRSVLARRRAVVRATRALEILGLYAEIDVAQRHALRLGAGTRPSLVARLLGLGRVSIPLASIVSLLRAR